MTEESKNTLRFLLKRDLDKEIEDALRWAAPYEVKFKYRSKTAYMIASILYLYETATGRPNNIGKALCGTFDEFNEDEAEKVVDRFKFSSNEMYNVVKEWEMCDEVPLLFDVISFTKEYEILHTAAANDDPDVLHWLFSKEVFVDLRDSFGRTALHIAAGNGMMRITRCLLSFGASIFSQDKEHRTPLESSLQRYKFEISEFLRPDMFCNLKRRGGETLLMRLTRDGLLPQVKYMLRYADFSVVNEADQNLLHVCVLSGQAKVMGAILHYGVPTEIINAVDAFNKTPLYLAIRNKKTVIVEQLLAAGAAVSAEVKNIPTSREITDLINEYSS